MASCILCGFYHTAHTQTHKVCVECTCKHTRKICILTFNRTSNYLSAMHSLIAEDQHIVKTPYFATAHVVKELIMLSGIYYYQILFQNMQIFDFGNRLTRLQYRIKTKRNVEQSQFLLIALCIPSQKNETLKFNTQKCILY